MTAFATVAEYEASFRQACANGTPPDALRRETGPEPERFFARTIPGPDGHTYWDGKLEKRRITDEQMLGAIQVVALHLGRAPTAVEYAAARSTPSFGVIKVRFGSWLKAVTAAGLTPTPAAYHKRGPDDCIAALQHLARHLGHVPSDKEFRAHAQVMRDADLPTSTATIRTHLGRPWSVALPKAGLA